MEMAELLVGACNSCPFFTQLGGLCSYMHEFFCMSDGLQQE